MRKAHGVSALLIGIAAICAGAAADSATAAAPASLRVPSGVYAGTIELPDPFARSLDQPFRLTLSRPRRIVRLPRFRVYMDCPHGYVAWWTYVLPELHTRAGRFNAHRRITRVRAGHSWRTSLDLRGRIVPAPVPGVAGRLRATIWVPRIDRGGARVCRSGFRHFDMTVTRGAPTAHGALRQLPGRAGCVGHLVDAAAALRRPARSARSSSPVRMEDMSTRTGEMAYIAFSRAPGTGALSPLDGSSACLSVGGDPGCAPADRMRFPSGFAFSPDGTSLYVPWSDHSGPGMSRSGLSVLRRDPATGTLSELAGDGGCLDDQGLEACTRWMHIVSSPGIAAAPDGRHVYVGTQGFGDYFGGLRVAVLKVDPATGGLRPPDPAVCPRGVGGCRAGIGVRAVRGRFQHHVRRRWAEPLRGRSSAAPGSGDRPPGAPVAGRKGCYFVPDRDAPKTDPPRSSCTALRAFVGIVEDVVASPDGRQVYMIDEGTAVGGTEPQSRDRWPEPDAGAGWVCPFGRGRRVAATCGHSTGHRSCPWRPMGAPSMRRPFNRIPSRSSTETRVQVRCGNWLDATVVSAEATGAKQDPYVLGGACAQVPLGHDRLARRPERVRAYRGGHRGLRAPRALSVSCRAPRSPRRTSR